MRLDALEVAEREFGRVRRELIVLEDERQVAEVSHV